MDIFINTLLTILYTFLILVLIFLFFIFSKLSLVFHYKNGLIFVTIKIFFFKKTFRIDDKFLEESKKEVKVDVEKSAEFLDEENNVIQQSETSKNEKSKILDSESIDVFYRDIETLKKFIEAAKYSVIKLANKIYISEISLFVLACEEEPSATALKIGHLYAYINSLYVYLKQFFNLHVKTIVLRPNFVDNKKVVNFSCKISFRPVIIINIGWKFGKIFLKKYLKKIFPNLLKEESLNE